MVAPPAIDTARQSIAKLNDMSDIFNIIFISVLVFKVDLYFKAKYKRGK